MADLTFFVADPFFTTEASLAGLFVTFLAIIFFLLAAGLSFIFTSILTFATVDFPAVLTGFASVAGFIFLEVGLATRRFFFFSLSNSGVLSEDEAPDKD